MPKYLKRLSLLFLFLFLIVLMTGCTARVSYDDACYEEYTEAELENILEEDDSGAFIEILISDEAENVGLILHAGGGDDLTYLNSQETFYRYYDMGYRYFEYDLKLLCNGRVVGTHNWEYLDVDEVFRLTYDDFISLTLVNGYTPINEEWLMQTIAQYEDVIFVIDSKMDTDEDDLRVLRRLEELAEADGLDISDRIIPEIFSKEMWDEAKETLSFNRYLFSLYKVDYDMEQILEYFDDERIVGVSVSLYCDESLKNQLYRVKESKYLCVFSVTTESEIREAIDMGADALYVDFVSFTHDT
ncbi:MAG: hypothetical protein IJ038_04225 [Clostridia bacterium]|nr:hypothetical protein [Clostridia bacterium]